ncbi:MAG TPA: TRAM domain-containing protein [Acidimicrobiales bacterium]|nr:TRAM domain-containing protein [Acidimicrobiales bacterium]
MTEADLWTTGVSPDGRAVAREDSGRVVFVADALPGERVRVAIGSERPTYASGTVLEVLEASPDRREAPCRHVAEGCGGCRWQHVAIDAQRRLKEDIVTDSLRRIGGVASPPLRPTVALEPWSYRTTLRAAVLDGRAALRRAGSNQPVGVDGCLVVHPLLSDLVAGRRYDGAEEVILRCGARTGERMAAPLPAGVPVDVPADVRPDFFHEQAAGRAWRISARSFFQTRPDGVDALARLVLDAAANDPAPGSGDALDLYSGVGLFAGLLADRGWRVTAVEGASASVADARHNLRHLGVRVVRADVTGWRPGPAGLVVADPSRNGLGRRGVEVVTASGARRVVLVSCDAASLGRDAGLLERAGYRLTAVTPVDLFPHTPHVEVVTVFDRRPDPGPG